MRELYELIYVLRTGMNYVKHDWDFVFEKLGVKEVEMLQVLLTTPQLDDHRVAGLINVDSNSGKFRRYKRVVRKVLYNQLLLFPVSESTQTSFQKNYYSSNQQAAILGVLKGLTYNSLAKSIADDLIVKARKYFFNEIRLEACQYLVKYYTIIEIHIKKAEDYYKELEHCLFLISKENEVQWKYSQLVANRVKARVDLKTLHEMGLQFVNESEGHLAEMSESFKFQGSFFRMAFLTFEITGDFRTALKYAKQGYEFFKQLPFSHVYAESGHLVKMARCYLYLNELEKGKSALDIAIQGYRVGSMNWFVCGYQKVMIDIHLGEYNRAHDLHENMLGQRTFKKQNEEIRSFNLLVGGYLEFLLRVGRIDTDKKVGKFRMNKFVNEMSNFEHDKERMKIPLIVIQLLFNIYDRDYDGMEQKIYSLKDFCSRNLVRKSPNFRSNCFIKMLLEVPINNFNSIAVKRKTEKYLHRMRSVTYNIAAPLAGVEVIPYEDLWVIILDHLKSPKRKRKTALEKSMFVV